MAAGVGAQVAGYRLMRVIGEGGMSIVYLAERVPGGEKVALKILRDELFENEDFRRRFVRESRYAASLDHPNVVKVLDAGETGETSYIAMEYVEGRDLYALLEEEGALDAGVTVAILAQVGAALDAAHLIGLVHRDVKPGNVLMSSLGGSRAPRCLLADFGLGKQATKDSVALTGAGSFVGTLAYTAPEQMIGPEPGAQADVYSLGCLLYECLAGEPPFTGTEVEVMQGHIESSPPKLSKKRSSFSPQIDAVIGRAMAKEPGQRHPDCAQLVAAAAAALGVQVPAVAPAEGIKEFEGTLELLVTAGNSVGSRIRVGDELLIGRDQSGEDGTLGDDPEISRRHARISRGPGGSLLVEDLGSTNGSFVNGRRTMGLEILRPGDELDLGSTRLLAFVAAIEEAPEPPPSPPPGEPPIARLSLRLELDKGASEARLEVGRAGESVGLVHDGARWRFRA